MVPRVLFLGPKGTFSHAAAKEALPNSILHEAPDFPTIFQRLQDYLAATTTSSKSTEQPCDHAIIPVYNSTNGPVEQVVHLLQRTGHGDILPSLIQNHYLPSNVLKTDPQESSSLPKATYPDLELAPEQPTYVLRVQHHLFVHQDCPITSLSPLTTNPSTRDGTPYITSLHTHPQVWTQCTRFLSKHFPSSSSSSSATCSRRDHLSTSDAARYVAGALPPPTTNNAWPAAIGPPAAGAAHGLRAVALDLQDNDDNSTTFVILRNRRAWAERGVETG